MSRVLAISSQVVRGHVGLSAIVPALQRLGHEVLPLPTIILSNHPGHKRAAGTRMEVNTLACMLEALDANGWLAGLDAIITGYMPSPDHVALAADAIDRVRAHSPAVTVLVDPVLGDDPLGLYIEVGAALAIRDQLVPRANIITPNRFELSFLSGIDVTTADDIGRARTTLPISLGCNLQVLATSIPASPGRFANVALDDTSRHLAVVERLERAPHGTGDLLTGLYVGHRLAGAGLAASLSAAVAGVHRAITNSVGQTDLDLTVSSPATDWATARTTVLEPAP